LDLLEEKHLSAFRRNKYYKYSTFSYIKV
jgi:hypothetical protein